MKRIILIICLVALTAGITTGNVTLKPESVKSTLSVTPAEKYIYVFIVKGLESKDEAQLFDQIMMKNTQILSSFTDIDANTCKVECLNADLDVQIREMILSAGSKINRKLSVELLRGPIATN